MPLVAHSELPTFRKLRAGGHDVLTLDRALSQDIRELHIGLLNMMPDAALAATERQYMRLIGGCNQIVQIYVYPFTVPGLPRSEATAAYIREHYAEFDQLKEDGLDALILSGANVTNPSIELEPFWQPLQEVVAWAQDNVTSMLCSCLATHALVKLLYQIDRHPLGSKRWGVYSHRVQDRSHPLMREINTRFDVPHSRWNEVRRNELEAAGLQVLADSDDAGVHMAVSPDRFRIVYFQGHPEYDTNSLLKEYKRESMRFLAGDIDEPPPVPEHYFSTESLAVAEAYRHQAVQAKATGDTATGDTATGETALDFPEDAFDPHLDNTWSDTGRALFNNWLGLVYQLTGLDRREPFMPGIDPDDPLAGL